MQASGNTEKLTGHVIGYVASPRCERLVLPPWTGKGLRENADCGHELLVSSSRTKPSLDPKGCIQATADLAAPCKPSWTTNRGTRRTGLGGLERAGEDSGLRNSRVLNAFQEHLGHRGLIADHEDVVFVAQRSDASGNRASCCFAWAKGPPPALCK